jgi:hypothetical protein
MMSVWWKQFLGTVRCIARCRDMNSFGPRKFKECIILYHENSGPNIAHGEKREYPITSCTSTFFWAPENGLSRKYNHMLISRMFLQNSGNYMYHLP